MKRIPAAIVLCALWAAAPAAQTIDHLVIVAPAAPGGGWDQTARALQHVVEARRLARVVEVQNVPGAAGTIGLSQFADSQRGRGDALLVTGLVMLGATLWNDSPVSIDQATPIARLTAEYEVIAVPASSPIGDMQALLAEFRARPNTFAWGGGSAGGSDHILAGLLGEAAGVDPRRINYVAFSGGGEAVAALLGGHIAAGISGYSEFAPHIATGRLRALGISAGTRVPGIDVPTFRETGLDVEMANWRGVLAPARLSNAQREALTSLVRAAVRSDGWRRLLAEREWTDQYLDGPEFAAFLDSEKTRYQRIVARLRGPAGTRSAPGRDLAPFAVLGGGAAIVVALLIRRRRIGSSAGAVEPASWRAVGGVGLALAVFLLLLPLLGFAGASSAMFVMIVRAFERAAADHRQERGARRPSLRPLIVGIVFCLVVYFAFTRGLDLPLPSGGFAAWNR